MCAGGTSAGSEEQTSHSYGMPTSSSIYSRAGGERKRQQMGRGLLRFIWLAQPPMLPATLLESIHAQKCSTQCAP